MYPTTLCSFWKNISGPRINLFWARFPCNHSYGYAFRRIVQTTATDGGSVDFASLHGKDCSYNPIAFPPSMEVRCNLVGQCRSNCRGASHRPDSLTFLQNSALHEISGLALFINQCLRHFRVALWPGFFGRHHYAQKNYHPCFAGNRTA